MAKWVIINVEKDKNGTSLASTHTMKVPGGMLVRTTCLTGMAIAFVPMESMMISPNKSVTDVWIEENEITK